jgi:proteic killer suppression protein
MIKHFKCKETEKLFWGYFSKKLPGNIQRTALRKLKILDAVSVLDTLKVPPGNKLESLHGDRAGQYSIRINEQWRICFSWREGNVCEVEIVDYH